MSKVFDPNPRASGRLTGPIEVQGEIVLAHDPNAVPATAVRNVLIQSSLTELKATGYYDRYAALIAPEVLTELAANLGPGWIPIELALAHYEACDKMNLSAEDFALLGARVGDRVQGAVLVTSAKKKRDEDFDLWNVEAQLHRMWARLFQGGSLQVVKLGPKMKLLQARGIRLNRYHYYRQGHLAALRATHSAIGVELTTLQIASYDEANDELTVRLGWL
ncbi:MAG TPA: hypothetical protein VGI70_04430 [Polyangiales bacterium]|jgi:hypothetical protein